MASSPQFLADMTAALTKILETTLIQWRDENEKANDCGSADPERMRRAGKIRYDYKRGAMPPGWVIFGD